MGALSDENPTYKVAYTVPASGRSATMTLDRNTLRKVVTHYAAEIKAGRVTDMSVTNRFGVDVTVDWFG